MMLYLSKNVAKWIRTCKKRWRYGRQLNKFCQIEKKLGNFWIFNEFWQTLRILPTGWTACNWTPVPPRPNRRRMRLALLFAAGAAAAGGASPSGRPVRLQCSSAKDAMLMAESHLLVWTMRKAWIFENEVLYVPNCKMSSPNRAGSFSFCKLFYGKRARIIVAFSIQARFGGR